MTPRRGPSRQPSPALVVAVAALVVALGGAAYSAIPDPAGVIHGCRDVNTGALRVQDTAVPDDDCVAPREAALEWNQQGPPGAAGPQGTAGPQGPPGLPPAYTKFAKLVTAPAKTSPGGPKTVVAKLAVPAGRYVVVAKVGANTTVKAKATIAGCFLEVGVATIGGALVTKQADDFASTDLIPGALGHSSGTLALMLAHEFEPRGDLARPGAIKLSCTSGVVPSQAIQFRNIRLVAMRVAELPALAFAKALPLKPKKRSPKAKRK